MNVKLLITSSQYGDDKKAFQFDGSMVPVVNNATFS